MEVTDEHRAMVILDQESRAVGVEPFKVKSKNRSEPYISARKMVYWRLYRELGWTHGRIGYWFGRDRSTIFLAIQKMAEVMGVDLKEELGQNKPSPRYYMDKVDTFGDVDE